LQTEAKTSSTFGGSEIFRVGKGELVDLLKVSEVRHVLQDGRFKTV